VEHRARDRGSTDDRLAIEDGAVLRGKWKQASPWAGVLTHERRRCERRREGRYGGGGDGDLAMGLLSKLDWNWRGDDSQCFAAHFGTPIGGRATPTNGTAGAPRAPECKK